MYTFQLLLPFLSTYILSNYIPFSKLPEKIRNKLPGLLWPDYWITKNIYQSEAVSTTDIASLSKKRPSPQLLLKMDNIMTSHMQDFLLLLTFGLCSPVLAIVIGLSIYISILHVRFIVGRFVLWRHPGLSSLISNLQDAPVSGRPSSRPLPSSRPNSRTSSVSVYQSDIGLIALTMALSDLGRSYHQVLWVIVWNSCLFWALLSWDIAGDEVGWNHCIWVPFLSIGHIVLMRIVIQTKRKYEDRFMKTETSADLIISDLHERGSVDIEELEENRKTVLTSPISPFSSIHAADASPSRSHLPSSITSPMTINQNMGIELNTPLS